MHAPAKFQVSISSGCSAIVLTTFSDLVEQTDWHFSFFSLLAFLCLVLSACKTGRSCSRVLVILGRCSVRAYHWWSICQKNCQEHCWLVGVLVGQVVYIAERKHSRAAAGNIRLMPDNKQDRALFAPTDHRVPRLIIPLSDCPHGEYGTCIVRTLSQSNMALHFKQELSDYSNFTYYLGHRKMISLSHVTYLVQLGKLVNPENHDISLKLLILPRTLTKLLQTIKLFYTSLKIN